MAAISTPATADSVPTRDFFKPSEFQEAALSPTGRYVAVTTPRGSSTKAATVDLDTMEIKTGMNVRDYEHVTDLTWIGDERFVFQIAQKYGSFDRPLPRGELYASDADGDRIRLVYPKSRGPAWASNRTRRALTVVSPMLDDPNDVMVLVGGAYPDVVRIDTLRGSISRVFINPLRGGYPLVQRDGKVIGVVGTAEDDSHDRVVLLGDGEGEWTELSRSALAEGSQTPVGLTPERIYVLSDLETPTMSLVAIDRKTGKRELIVPGGDFDLQGVVMSSDEQTPLAAWSLADRPSIHLIDKQHREARLIAGLLSTFPDSTVGLSGFSRDGRYALVVVSSDRDPGRYYRYDTHEGTLRFLFARNAWLKPEQMAHRTPIKFKARDGLTIHGYLTLPSDRPAQSLPLIVIPHGGPHGIRDVWTFDPEAQFLAHHGYAVLQVNFRGSGGYGREFLRAGFRRWGKEMIDDITDGVLEVVKAGIADRDRLCIYGASYGGYAAMMSVAKEPDLYQCGVGYVGVYDLRLMYARGDVRERPEGTDYLERVIGRDEDDLEAQSPVTHAHKIKASLFLVHGWKDRRVPNTHYTVFTKRLDELGKPYESLIKANEAHGFYNVDNRVELYDRMLAFFDKHIGDKR